MEFFQIKLSVYEDEVEEAWATFTKNSGADDAWFHFSRVKDSFPWDKTLLQENTVKYQEYITTYHGDIFWTMSEGSKFNVEAEDRLTAHARWVTLATGHSCDLVAGTPSPVILYSKQAGPEYLLTRGRPSVFFLKVRGRLIIFKAIDI